ncbi:hypothetical protein ABK040_005338 [Willaertia magna]
MLWRDITLEQIQEITKGEKLSTELLRKNIDKVLGLRLEYNYLNQNQYEILLDFFLHSFIFSFRNKFTPEKISCFFSIIKELQLDTKNHDINLYNSFIHFKQLLLKFSVHRPPFSIEIFNVDDVRKISEYVYNTFYRHYKLYQYTFCLKHVATVESKLYQPYIETPFEMLSLGGAMTLEEWKELEKQRKEEEMKRLAEEQEKLNTTSVDALERSTSSASNATFENAEVINSTTAGTFSTLLNSNDRVKSPHSHIKKQLEPIKKEIEEMTNSRLNSLNSRLEQLEIQTKKPTSKK